MKSSDIATVGATTVAGGAAGLLLAKRKIGKTVDPDTLRAVKSMTKDEYVASRVMANVEQVTGNLEHSYWAKEYSKIRDKAAWDYESVKKLCKKTKVKYVAIFAAIGLALGTLLRTPKSKGEQ